MLSSAEHEILNAYKQRKIKKFSFLSGSDKPSCWHFNIYEQEKFNAQLNITSEPGFGVRWLTVHEYTSPENS